MNREFRADPNGRWIVGYRRDNGSIAILERYSAKAMAERHLREIPQFVAHTPSTRVWDLKALRVVLFARDCCPWHAHGGPDHTSCGKDIPKPFPEESAQ